MSTAICNRPVSARSPINAADIRQALMEDDSPFGIQGLMRERLQILKPQCLGALAATLAVTAKPDQIRDRDFVAQVLAGQSQWQEEFQVVHLIEKSLWIDGHSDLVLTLTRDPSQIPDNPPAKVLEALTLANRLHPRSTIWYGVPLFSEETTADGLPIPLTAAQLREEAARRIAAAQQSALQWGWLYRLAHRTGKLPYVAWRLGRMLRRSVSQWAGSVQSYWQRMKRDARNRNRARILAASEYCRMGQSFTRIPEHTTRLGLFSEGVGVSIRQTNEFLIRRAENLDGMGPIIGGVAPVAIHTLTLTATIAPLLFAPLPIIVCDPFLFVELSEEPGKLRHLGHWYWQDVAGKQKLHLHV